VSDNRDDFVSFEKALRELKMRSEELKKLVSEGEIRAFRDGESMKFRKEDIAALSVKGKGEEELAFVDALEDDTGMVTEELSDEDTLIADDDVVEAKKPVRSARPAAAVAVGSAAAGTEPGWVTAAALVCFLVLIWGCLISFSISQEVDPSNSSITSMFAAGKADKK
jgi:hypothetical protein